MITASQARDVVRTRGLALLADAGINFILPLLIYSFASPKVGDVRALLASSLPPILWSIAELIRHRRLDALSLLVLAGIALSLLAFFGGGGARMLQLREKLVTGVIGATFLISAGVKRPLIYELARAGMVRRDSGNRERLPELESSRGFRRTMTIMTLVWGFGLIVDVAIGVALVFTLTIKQYLIVNPLEGYAILGSLSLWTWWYGQRARKRGEARRAAELADAQSRVSYPH